MTAPNLAASGAASVARTSLVLRDRLTPEQVELLKRTVAKGASDDEFALFLHQCERTGLNPFARQIYCLGRRTRDDAGNWVVAMVTQVGIDGQRLVAERTGLYRGQTVPVFFDAAGNAREVWLDTRKPPVACKVGVMKEGFAEPLYVVALYDEYVQRKRDNQPAAMWANKPTVMLAKCAEAAALRKAFPQELSGLYTEEEVPPENIEEPAAVAIPTAHTRSHLIGTEQSATVTADGYVRLTFGEFKDRNLPDVPTSYLLANFRDPWLTQARKDTATQRLGAGFVAAVYGELERRSVPADLSVSMAKLLERRAAGEVLTDDDAEYVRQWDTDHPVKAEAGA